MYRYNKVTVEKGGSVDRITPLQGGAILGRNNGTITYNSVKIITSL